ncbi:MAG: PilZ domain-containing protein [Candidatus Omnitrophica bacterium]|nr:PilZ domain-containing protein [Candidatus Omnitrophota bacterium]MDD5487441.1 PilZ domain-containing protein [Candidatus Omnitrophota bacterium]
MTTSIMFYVLLVAIPVIIAAVVAGAVMSYLIYEKRGKISLRQMMEEEKGSSPGRYAECRKHERIPKDSTVTVQTERLDNAGVSFHGETMTFEARVLDVSKSGISIISGVFLKKGQIARIYSHDDMNVNVSGEVRNLKLMPSGIRIGFKLSE